MYHIIQTLIFNHFSTTARGKGSLVAMRYENLIENENENTNKFALKIDVLIRKYGKVLINSQHTAELNYLYRIIICTYYYHLIF